MPALNTHTPQILAVPCCSPGSCFFLPHGMRIYNALQEYVREKYWAFEYEEVRQAAVLCCSKHIYLIRKCMYIIGIYILYIWSASESACVHAALPGASHMSNGAIYTQVMTPNIYNFDLWKTSGHADHYRENMFSFSVRWAFMSLFVLRASVHALFANNRRLEPLCTGGEGGIWPQAHELPGPLPHVCKSHPVIPRVATAVG